MRTALLLVALLLAGCSSAPPPPSPVPPPMPAPPSSPPAGPAADGPGPEVLVNGENARIRVVLAEHRVAGDEASIALDIRNKEASGSFRFGYGILAFASGGDTYFDLPGAIEGSQEARFRATSRDDAAELRSRWSNLSLYYRTFDAGGEPAGDAAVQLDLRNLNLPTNVS